jgi:serine/threonine protein kinase
MAGLAQYALLGDRYRLSRRIAVGGMGEVWQAEDSVLHRTVAVKVLKSELTSDPTFLERFRAEARTTAALSHPGIANVFDYGEAALDGAGGPDTAYLVMEFVDGEPLSAILARSGRLPVARTLEVLGQAAAALDVAHRAGMVHRDVKPGNLLVRPDGVVKITDFGIARAADAVPLTQSGMVVGTAQYFSPEQAEGRVVTAASDVYSLGVVGYECLAGRLPFVADSAVAVAMMQIREIPPPLPADIPAPMRALLARTLAKDPRARFGTGGEFAAAVRAVRQGRYEDPTALIPSGPLGPNLRQAPGAPGAPGAAPPPRMVPMPGAPGGPVPGGPVPGGPVQSGAGPGGPVGGAHHPGAPSLAGPVPAAGPPTGHILAPPPTGRLPGGIPPGSLPPGTQLPGAQLPGAQPPSGPVSPHRTPRWAFVVAALLVLALVVAGSVTALLSRRSTGGSGPGPGTTSSTESTAGPNEGPSEGPSGGLSQRPGGGPTTAPGPGPIALDKSDYIGGDVNEVADRLRALQLRPVLRTAAGNSRGRPNEVVDLVWSGQLTPGSEIIVIAIPIRGRGGNK